MKRLIATLVATLLLAGGASAQTETEAALQSQVDSLQNRLSRVEKRVSTWEKIRQHLQIGGIIQPGYAWADRTESSFYIKRARVIFGGDLFGSKVDYRLQVDFAGSPQILDLYVRYRPFNGLGIQAGEFQIPLSIENTEHGPLRLEFIDYSLAVQRLVRMSGNDVSLHRSTGGRDLGAQLYGGFVARDGYNLITYNLAIFNGNGINRRDDNKGKDIVARVMVNPLKELTLAGYYQYGEGVYPDFGTSDNVRLQRYGGGLAHDCKSFFVRSEYIGGTTGDVRSEGAYIAGGYKFLGKGCVAVRFDYFDNDKRDRNGWEYNYTLGLSYFPLKFLRLQLDYTLQQFCGADTHHRSINGLNFLVSASF